MVRLLAFVLLAQHFEVVGDCGGPTRLDDPPGQQLAMGDEHGCAVQGGVVSCWGANASGQLGRGSPTPFESRAAPVAFDEQIAQVASGEASACARTVTGRVFCWGNNANAQLGRPEPAFSATPLEVVVPVPVKRIALHSDYVLALGTDGRLFGWGNDSEGTLARSDENPMTWPWPRGVVRVAFDHRFKEISAGQGHACGIDLDDALWCWGRDNQHQLGSNSIEDQLRSPVKVLDGVSSVVVGAFGGCAIRAGSLLCWGDTLIADDGQHLQSDLPAVVPIGAPVRLVDQIWFHLCAATTDDRLFCWGRGIEGQLGLGAIDPSPVPREVMSGVRSVSTGHFCTCVLRLDGGVACMGENNLGQLGLGDTSRRSVPTPW